MSIEYTWKIQSMRVLPELSDKNNIVKTVDFMLEGVRNEKNNFVLGSVELSLKTENFIPFDELTEEIVIDWVKDALGSERIDQYIDTIEQRFGPEVLMDTPLPWGPPTEPDVSNPEE